MNSDNENLPSTSESNVGDETSNVIHETSTIATTQPTSHAALDVHALKERIIATNKLFKYLQDAKKELTIRETQISTLNTNLGLSIKNLQESDEKYKKSIGQVKSLENQLKSKSAQVDSLTEANKTLKNDLRKQADLSKRMGSTAAEFRIAKDQLTKLTEENQQLKESISALQTEKDQLDEDAMETSINNNLTIESLQDEISDLKSSLTNNDSAVVSLKLQLTNEQNKALKANTNIKSLEQNLYQSNEQIRHLNTQLHAEKIRNQQQAPIHAGHDEIDNLKRMHAEEINKLKELIQQLNAKAERKVAIPSTSHIASHPDLIKKYHKLKGEYQLIKRKNIFLEQELQNLLTNESENRGIATDSDPDDMEDVFSFGINMPFAHDVVTSASKSSPSSTVKPMQKSVATPLVPTLNYQLLKDPRLQHQQHQRQTSEEARPQQQQQQQQRQALEETRLQQQQHQRQISEEARLQQKSGLIAPPSQMKPSKLPKKQKSLLVKFANAKNPSKVLERAKAPVTSTTPTTTPSKKRPFTEIESDDHKVDSTSTSSSSSSSSTTTTTATTTTTTTSAAAASTSTILLKKAKADYHLNHVIEGLFNKDNGKLLPTKEECRDIAHKLLEEVQECYTRIKSIVVPAEFNLVPFGVSDLMLPKTMDYREKVYAWFLVSLFKVDNEEFNQLMLKFTKIILTCPVPKLPINNKLVRFIRLFTAACKAENSLGRLRSLFYALFRTTGYHTTIIPSLLNAGLIWKESFIFNGNDQYFECLNNTFVSCVNFINCRPSTARNVKEMHQQLKTVFNWSSQPKQILECVQDSMNILQSVQFKELNAKDKPTFDLLSFNLITSFELSFIVLDDWKQTYDVFIRTKLWPVLNMEIIDVVAMELLGVLARLGISDDPLKSDKPGVVTLLDTFSTIIDLGEDIDPNEKHLQFAATKSMAAVAGNHYQYKKFLVKLHDI